MTAIPKFPTIARRGHRPLMGDAPRVFTPGATVTRDTHDSLFGWTLMLRRSRGMMLDELVAFARAKGFSPQGSQRTTTTKQKPKA